MPAKRGPYVRSAATRARILSLLAQRPGMTRADLQRETGLAWGTVAHHLRSMSDRGEVEAHRVGRRAHFVVAQRASKPAAAASTQPVRPLESQRQQPQG